MDSLKILQIKAWYDLASFLGTRTKAPV